MLDEVSGGDDGLRRISDRPEFQALVRERTSFAWMLSGVMLVIYFSFILLADFGKDFMAAKVGGGTTSLGIVLGLGVIVASFILTGIYVGRANTRFDQLTRDLRKGL